jgi:PAS domain-containing protein
MRPDSSLPGSEQLRELFFSHQRITKVNDAMVAQYGTSREKLIGLTPGDFYAHDREYGKQVWQTFFDAGRLHTDADEHRFDGTPIRMSKATTSAF